MRLDTLTILVMSGAVVAIAGVSFILHTILRPGSLSGRLWSAAFVAGILETIAYLVWAVSDTAWWSSGIGNAAAVLAVAYIWHGARAYNARSRLFLSISAAVALLVAVAFLVEGPRGGDWAGAVPLFLGILGFAILSGLESLRGNLGATGNGRVLSAIMWIVAAYYTIRIVVFLVAGEGSPLFLDWFGTTVTTFISLLLVIVAAISISVLQPAAERMSDGVVDLSPSTAGALTMPTFTLLAENWLLRARRDREPLVQLEVAVDNLEHITTAFGRGVANEAIALVASILVRDTPSAALVGHRGDGRFSVLTTPPSFGSATDIADALQTSLVETPLESESGVRVLCTFGIASTEETGYELGDLANAARDVLRTARAVSPGSVLASGDEAGEDGPTGES